MMLKKFCFSITFASFHASVSRLIDRVIIQKNLFLPIFQHHRRKLNTNPCCFTSHSYEHAGRNLPGIPTYFIATTLCQCHRYLFRSCCLHRPTWVPTRSSVAQHQWTTREHSYLDLLLHISIFIPTIFVNIYIGLRLSGF